MTYSLSSDMADFACVFLMRPESGFEFYAASMSCCIVEKLMSGEGRQASREAAETGWLRFALRSCYEREWLSTAHYIRKASLLLTRYTGRQHHANMKTNHMEEILRSDF